MVEVKTLADTGMNLDGGDGEGRTALFSASLGGHVTSVENLVGKGADVNKAESTLGHTPLYAAAWGGHNPVVQVLLGNGADVNQVDAYGWTALLGSAYCGHLEVAKSLLGKGADRSVAVSTSWTDEKGLIIRVGSTALSVARLKGHKEMVALLDAGKVTGLHPSLSESCLHYYVGA